MLQCSQPSQMPAGPRPRWISAATRLVGPLLGIEPAISAEPISARSHSLSVDATDRGRRSFVAHHENRNALSRLYRRAEALPRRLYHRPADQPGRARSRRRGAGKANAEPSGPDAAHIKAQDKVIASGKKLADQEKFKREEHPFDAYPRLKQQALNNAPPSPADNFRWRYYGLFYVAPAQDSYMCRLADSERHPQALAIRRAWPISPSAAAGRSAMSPPAPICRSAKFRRKHAVALIEGIQDLGLCSRGSGADNIRNVTGTPTAGIDPQELIDTRDICPRMALSHPQRPLADGTAAQVQRRLRRRRQDRGAGRHQRHRLRGGRGEGRFRRRARHLVSARASAASPATRILPRRPASSSSRRTRPKSPTPSCACSSISATAPTGSRRG